MACCLLHTVIGETSKLSCADTLADATVELEAALIKHALFQFGGNHKSEHLENAAHHLGLNSRQALLYIINGRLKRGGYSVTFEPERKPIWSTKSRTVKNGSSTSKSPKN